MVLDDEGGANDAVARIEREQGSATGRAELLYSSAVAAAAPRLSVTKRRAASPRAAAFSP